MTKQELQEELKQSMLSKDAIRTSTLRMVISAIGYYEIQKGGAGYEASPEDVQNVIEKEAKKIKDSIEQYKLANREDLVEKETTELKVLNKYLPTQLNDDEIIELVNNAISQTGASGISDIGKVMGVLMSKTKGRADGALVSKIVKDKLTHSQT